MTEAQIKHMVDRFLSWRLPKNFNPDGGISYTRPNYAVGVDATPNGTNLLDADQAGAMVRHMLDGLPPAARQPSFVLRGVPVPALLPGEELRLAPTDRGMLEQVAKRLADRASDLLDAEKTADEGRFLDELRLDILEHMAEADLRAVKMERAKMAATEPEA